MRFSATNVTVQELDETLVVGFIDESATPATYLTIQRALEPSQQDRRLGHNRAYVEFNDQLNSAYCDIGDATLKRDSFTFTIDGSENAAFTSDRRVEINFSLESDQFATLKKAISRIVGAPS